MKLFIFFSFSLSLLLLQTPSSKADLIHEICRKASKGDPQLSYKFCITALQSNPRSPTADLSGLGSISIQLSIDSARRTGSHIKEMLKSGPFDSFDRQCLDVCSELYSDAISTLMDSLKALGEKRFDDANIWVSSVMDASSTCEDGFKEREGPVSPLTKENNYLFQLSGISLAIINFLG